MSYIKNLNPSTPVGQTDFVSEGDDHLRETKLFVVQSFPNIGGPVTASHIEINGIIGAIDKSFTSLTAVYEDIDTSPLGASFADYRIMVVSGSYRQSIRVDALITGQFTTFSHIGNDLIDIDISISATNQIVLRVRMKEGTGTIYYFRTAV